MRITEETPEARKFSIVMNKREISLIYRALLQYSLSTGRNSDLIEHEEAENILKEWNSIR